MTNLKLSLIQITYNYRTINLSFTQLKITRIKMYLIEWTLEYHILFSIICIADPFIHGYCQNCIANNI